MNDKKASDIRIWVIFLTSDYLFHSFLTNGVNIFKKIIKGAKGSKK